MPEKITFSNGRTENVYSVPPNLTGNIKRQIENDPRFAITDDDTTDDVIRKGCERDDAVYKETRGAALAWAFQDTKVPDGWQFPRIILEKGITPRDGDDGRLADYIEYGLLANAKDANLAGAVMAGLTEEDIGAASAGFRPCRFAAKCPFSKIRRKK